jgi:phage N-6-adenine-methyltransferase
MSGPMFRSHSDEWHAPIAVYQALDTEFGFDYDPCPLHDGGLISDGLLADWGAVTFCNPPYSRIADWVRKAHHEARRGKTVVLLIPARTDTRWWHDHVMQAAEIRFIKGRLRFGDAKTGAPFPSCIVVWRPAQYDGSVRDGQ